MYTYYVKIHTNAQEIFEWFKVIKFKILDSHTVRVKHINGYGMVSKGTFDLESTITKVEVTIE